MILPTFPCWGVESVTAEIGADISGLVLTFSNNILIMRKCHSLVLSISPLTKRCHPHPFLLRWWSTQIRRVMMDGQNPISCPSFQVHPNLYIYIFYGWASECQIVYVISIPLRFLHLSQNKNCVAFFFLMHRFLIMYVKRSIPWTARAIFKFPLRSKLSFLPYFLIFANCISGFCSYSFPMVSHLRRVLQWVDFSPLHF